MKLEVTEATGKVTVISFEDMIKVKLLSDKSIGIAPLFNGESIVIEQKDEFQIKEL